MKHLATLHAAMANHWLRFITVATLLIGNITAVFQQSVKRMLAYSSIAQAGFMLFAIYAMNTDAKEGIVIICSCLQSGHYWHFCRLGKNE